MEGDTPLARPLPRALLVDLDDTILDASSARDSSWDEAFRRAAVPEGVDREALRGALGRFADEYWSDADRHRRGRLDMRRARRDIVEGAFERLGLEEPELAVVLADAYLELRFERLRPFPGAVEALEWFRSRGTRLALVTNGASADQRAKIRRFALAPLFDGIFVEGELGYGKPDERVFRDALAAVGAEPAEAWIAGDNLHWEIGPARALGMHAVWVDHRGAGLPQGAGVRPDRIVRSLAELAQQ